MKYFWRYVSPLGKMEMKSDDGINLSGLKFGEFDEFYGEFKEQNLQIFKDTCKWLDIYFNGNLPKFTPKISLNSLYGSEFSKSVWQILCQIDYATTMTYGEIAEKIANKKCIAKMSAQAVGGAIKRNPIVIIIPCHRVLGRARKLTGYAYGLDKKMALLDLENPYNVNF